MVSNAPKPPEDLSTDANQKKIKNAAKKLQQEKDDLLYKISNLKREIARASEPKGTSSSSYNTYQQNLTASEKYAISIVKRDKEYEIAALEEKIQALDESLADPQKAFEYEQSGKDRYGKFKVSKEAPYLTEDVKQQFVAAGIAIGDDAAWYNGGLGNVSSVYMGPGKTIETKRKGTKGVGYRKLVEQTDDVGYKANIQREFWTNDSIKNQIMGAYASVGKTLTQWDASQLWDQYVERAAIVYQGGKGKKLTPYDLMQDDLANMRKNAAPKDTLTKTKLDYAEVRDLLREVALNTSGFVPGEKVLKKAFEDFEKKNRGVYSQNSLVNAPGGKAIDKSVVDRGLTNAEIKRQFEQQMEKKNPLETERQNNLDFNNALMRKIGGGAI
jgi:hypothetical protein